jgi:hypothetical protein
MYWRDVESGRRELERLLGQLDGSDNRALVAETHGRS